MIIQKLYQFFFKNKFGGINVYELNVYELFKNH